MKKAFKRWWKKMSEGWLGGAGAIRDYDDTDTIAPTKPKIYLVSQSGTQVVIGFTYYASDKYGIGSYDLYRDDVRIQSYSRKTTTMTDSDYDGAAHTYYVKSVDNNGNETQSNSITGTFTSDSTAPTNTSITVDDPAADSFVAEISAWVHSDAVGVTGWLLQEGTTQSGTHDGGDASSDLTDSGQTWVTDAYVDYTVHNITQGTSERVTTNTDNDISTDSLSWDDGDTYVIYLDSDWLSVEPVTFTLSGLGAKTVVGWVRDAAGNVSTSVSDTSTATASATQGLRFASPVVAATGLTFASPVRNVTPAQLVPPVITMINYISPTELQVVWTEPSSTSGFANYELWYEEDGQGYAQYSSPSIGSTTENVVGLTSETTYNFYMLSTDGSNDSANSAIVSGTTPAVLLIEPPTNVQATKSGVDEITITWTENAQTGDVSVYNVYRVGNSVPVDTVGIGTAQSIQSGLSDGNYTYYVTGATAGGVESSPSNNTTKIQIGSLVWRLNASAIIPGKLPFRWIYPRPDAETNAWARHKSAHTQMDYTIMLGVQGGSWPYLYEFVNTPPSGMTLGQTYGTTASPNSDYGIITWPKESIAALGSGTYSIKVRATDQELNIATRDGSGALAQQDVTFTITIDDDMFVFMDKDNGASGNAGTYAAPKEDIADVATSSFAGKIAVFKDSTAYYTMQTQLIPKSSTMPLSWIGETIGGATIDFFYGGVGENPPFFKPDAQDVLFEGFNTVGMAKDETLSNLASGDNGKRIVHVTFCKRLGFHRITVRDMYIDVVGPQGGTNSAVLLIQKTATASSSKASYITYLNNDIANVPRSVVGLLTYNTEFLLADGNKYRDVYAYYSDIYGGSPCIYTKGGSQYSTTRNNDIWDSNIQEKGIFIYHGRDGDGGYSGYTPHDEEICWNRCYVSKTAPYGAGVLDGLGIYAPTYNYYYYHNTVYDCNFSMNNQDNTTDDTLVQQNVCINDSGGIDTNSQTKLTLVDNLESSDSTKINTTTGLLTDAAISAEGFVRGDLGHEVYI